MPLLTIGVNPSIPITRHVFASCEQKYLCTFGKQMKRIQPLCLQRCHIKRHFQNVQEKMVGYEKNDTMSPHQKLIAGCVAGVITRFITQPMDVVKLRTQLQKPLPSECRRQWFMITRRVLKEEGVTAFWHGHNLGQVHSIMAISSQFYVYELATKYVESAPVNNKVKHALVFLSGIVAGCISTVLVNPIEVVRVRQMVVRSQYKGLIRGAREVYNSGGLLAFYHGLSASLLQMGPQVGISFCVFSFLQPFILRSIDTCEGRECDKQPKPEHLLLASTVAGSFAGFTSKTITYPLDLAKRRLQMGSHIESEHHKPPSTSRHLFKCTHLFECLIQMYQDKGLVGLFRGWKVTIFKAQLSSVVAFTTYELICYSLRETPKR